MLNTQRYNRRDFFFFCGQSNWRITTGCNNKLILEGGGVATLQWKMKLSIRVVLLVATSACIDIAPASALKIGAFNVQVFGPTKFSDSTVVATLSKVS